MEYDIHCPHCKKLLSDFSTGKDLVASDGENDIILGRLNILGCSDCDYIQLESIWFS